MTSLRTRTLFVALLAGMLWPVSRLEAQVRIRLATLAPKGTVYHQALQGMAEDWRQAPGGGVALTIYTDGTMGSEPEMVRRMRIGQIQAALLTTIGMAEIEHSVTALQDMPMMFRSVDEMEHVRAALRSDLEKRFLDKGFVVLAWGDTGWVRFFSRQPALRPDEFKSMRMFASASDQDQIEIMKSVGYRPVPLEWTDVLTGLQTGLIDAVPSAPMIALAGQYFTVTHHMLDVNWVPLVGGLVVTKKAWDSTPEAARARLRRAAEMASAQIQRRSRVEEEEAIAAMQKRGLVVHPLTPELQAEWRRTAESFYPRIRGSIVPADVFDKVQQVLAQYRAEKAKAAL